MLPHWEFTLQAPLPQYLIQCHYPVTELITSFPMLLMQIARLESDNNTLGFGFTGTGPRTLHARLALS